MKRKGSTEFDNAYDIIFMGHKCYAGCPPKLAQLCIMIIQL